MTSIERDAQARIEDALEVAAEMNPQSTDGVWLEDLTVQLGPDIKEWDIEECHHWSEWPDRERQFPGTTALDVGIDAVATRRSDGKHIAIQCKSRQLDSEGKGGSISKSETDKFVAASSSEFWVERWVVTNGNNPLTDNTVQQVSMSGKPLKLVNITSDLIRQRDTLVDEECPHCQLDLEDELRIQTKSCMQDEAVAASVRILQEHERSDSGGLPVGQARGKLILPCGTGKTRISLRIVEELTRPGGLAIVLCPSIALVAQIRREYLEHASQPLRALAVCSDQTAGYDPRKEGRRNATSDPTVDNSFVSADEIKGYVTTDASEISAWIDDRDSGQSLSVIFGTYQSGHRVAEALSTSGVKADVLIADEAHRTAGLRRKRRRNAKQGVLSKEEQRIRDFTLCHDNDAFPAIYRVYQTATPRIYDTRQVRQDQSKDWIVRSMDDETVFGVELYRKSYVEAVRNHWLADYRIIAVGVNDPDTFQQANALALNTESKGNSKLTVTNYLRGLAFALAMGGATQDDQNGQVPIRSCIAFMNTVDKSRNMAKDLETDVVRNWLQGWLDDNQQGRTAARYNLEHLDASSNVAARDSAKTRLAEADNDRPHGVINVGIFGEGTDSPSLSAVAFLEARKSPIDVIQAVGRAMRTAPGKDFGYIICPILIPPNADPETWLSTSEMNEGWQELGQILQALRAHDQRIEENLDELLRLYVPKPPPVESAIVAVAQGDDKRISYRQHQGKPGDAQVAVERVLEGHSTLAREFTRIDETQDSIATQSHPVAPDIARRDAPTGNAEIGGALTTDSPGAQEGCRPYQIEPTQIITGKKNADGSVEVRMDSVARDNPRADGTRGSVNIRKTKAKAKKMINEGTGLRLPHSSKRRRRSRKEAAEAAGLRMVQMSGLGEHGNAIRMNLLSKSGLSANRVVRDLNILEDSVREAAHHLAGDDLRPDLDRHFGLDNLDAKARKDQADGCTIAALLMMNAAMLHQRIAAGRWLSGVSDLTEVKNDVKVVRRISREWNRIMRHDFEPVLKPAVDAIWAVEDTGKLAGLERALRHLTVEAERIAEAYADMGADHAGPLFNRVMGNQASDGAFFTRPVAAAMAARLTLDACGDADWSDEEVWRSHKVVDLACGSGTLLAAMLSDMKRRAAAQGADNERMAELQRLGVEDTIKGLDINPVSLQLAASQLTTGNQQIRYKRMGLHLMPYGPHADDPTRVAVGTLELLGQKTIVPRAGELDLADDAIASQVTWTPSEDTDLEDAVTAVKDARIVIMNPPFTERVRMGQKFPKPIQQALRARTDALEDSLVRADPEFKNFVTRRAVRPLFVSLAECVVDDAYGIVAMVNPTIMFSSISGRHERLTLARRFHIHTILTSHHPGNINLSEDTSINESIIVMRRYPIGPKPPTRFIHLDRLPVDDHEVEDFHRCLQASQQGEMSNGWGVISYWPSERIEKGNWHPAIWRAPDLATAAWEFSSSQSSLIPFTGIPRTSVSLTRPNLILQFNSVEDDAPGSFPILKARGADGQQFIKSAPDERRIPKVLDDDLRIANGGTYPAADRILEKGGYLLVTDGQRNSTARLTATASDKEYVGISWMPVAGISPEQAKALAVFLNSTAGRLQIMSNSSRTLEFASYMPAAIKAVSVPDVNCSRIRKTLFHCWKRTKDMLVPQFRDGECDVRRLWDEAVADALDWDPQELRRLRLLLHKEPHVRGLGYNQYADEIPV